MGKKKPAPPPAPDYAAIARQQGDANLKAANQSAYLSNPNIYGPYGNQEVSWDAGPDGSMRPTIRQSLTPQAQAALDAQQSVQLGQARLGQQAMTQAQGFLNTPFQYNGPGIQTSFDQGPDARTDLGDYGQVQNSFNFDQARTALGDYGQVQEQLGDYGQIQNSIGGWGDVLRDIDVSGISNMPLNAGMTAQNAIMSRLDPQLKRDEAAQRARLINQGLTPGGEAYNADQNLFDQGRTDLYTQAGRIGLDMDMAANQQGFTQAFQRGGFQNAAQQQDYAQRLGQGQFANAAQAQGFGQLKDRGEFANNAQNQRYNQALGAGEFYNQGVGQNYAQNAGAAQFGNEAQNQRYNQALGSAGFYNQGLAQNYNNRLNAAQFGNAAVGQNLEHQLALRNQPLNEINALMQGSQIQAPQFQQYSGASVNAAPIFDAGKAQGTYNTDIYGQQMSGYNAGMQALGSAAGGLFGATSKPWFLSDVRLKSNIVRVGDHPLGIGIYEYDIGGRRERGVLAQEVEIVRPSAVAEHPSGYKMVNYGALN